MKTHLPGATDFTVCGTVLSQVKAETLMYNWGIMKIDCRPDYLLNTSEHLIILLQYL